MKHATLSASTAYRWLKCPPSAVLNAEIPDNPSPFSEEGIRAHKLAEYKVKRYLEMAESNKPPCDDEEMGTEPVQVSPLERNRATSDKPLPSSCYTEEMENATNDYLFFIADKVEGLENPVVLVEQKLDYSRYVPHGYGTGDCVICGGNKLIIVDFKYGKGVAISARENAQMMCYALGALALFPNAQTIEMNIIQPRIGGESTWSITRDGLIHWAENVLKPTALLASEGKGDFEAGKHCRFCKVRACRARGERCLSLEKLRQKAQLTDDGGEPPLVSPLEGTRATSDKPLPAFCYTDDEIAEVLEKIDDLVSWAKDIKAYATRRAQDGVQYKGFKLARTRSPRRYTDEKAVADIVEKAGYDPWEYRILGIGAMTKMLGVGQFNSLLSDYIEKPEGNPTLIRN